MNPFKARLTWVPPLLLLALLTLTASNVMAKRLGELVSVEGIRENQLVGYGLVVGLPGTGDKTQVKFTVQSIVNMLNQFGIKTPDKINQQVKNVAAVTVSATLPPGYRKGQTLDVTVSSLGDAKSLRGGTLLMTPLKAADGEVYALAQGNLVIGGVSAEGKSGSSVSINVATAGRIPNGATVEREIHTDFATRPTVRLSLKRPNFQTSTAIVKAINSKFGANIAGTSDATSIEVVAPTNPTERVAFVSQLEALNVIPGQNNPKVIFNSRTGTVVIDQGVTVRAAAVSHGTLTVAINETAQISQPEPLSGGRTVVVPDSSVSVNQNHGPMFLMKPSVSLQTVIDTINAIGASPDDVMAILQALDQAGALDGDLEVI